METKKNETFSLLLNPVQLLYIVGNKNLVVKTQAQFNKIGQHFYQNFVYNKNVKKINKNQQKNIYNMNHAKQHQYLHEMQVFSEFS